MNSAVLSGLGRFRYFNIPALSVDPGLGLTGNIGENTLGTLLGGVAGYVLSQGVGRAPSRFTAAKISGAEGEEGAKEKKN
ncbi:MAG: hypothetical protein U0X73_04235 [Thermoanaerobaculia bacterium]